MRLALTAVALAMGRAADVVLEADPATPVADLAAELVRFISGDAAGARHVPPGSEGGRGARVLRFPGPRSRGSLAMSSPVPEESRFPSRCT